MVTPCKISVSHQDEIGSTNDDVMTQTETSASYQRILCVATLDADTNKLNCVLETTKDFTQSGTKVSILGAIPGVAERQTETYPELADFEAEYKQKAVARLREAACEHGLFASTQVELGDASQLAAITANQLESQLIVVENDRCRDMMSSTAQHVMALAEMDVLFVNTDG